MDPWINARDRFLATLTDEEKLTFHFATLENLFYTSAAEPREYQKDSRAQALVAKLKPFTDAITNYGTALDVFSNTAPLILCPLWGSIRILLQVTPLNLVQLFLVLIDTTRLQRNSGVTWRK